MSLRVLVASEHAAWPLDHGGRLRLHHQLAVLGAVAEVTRLSLAADPAGDGPPGPARPLAWRGAAGDVGPARPTEASALRAAQRHFGWEPDFAAALARYSAPQCCDAVLLCGPRMGLYVDHVRAPAAWDLVDHPGLYAWTTRAPGVRAALGAAQRAVRYAAYVRAAAARVAQVWTAAPRDTDLTRRGVATRVSTLSNGVDFRYFAPLPEPPASQRIAFVGSLDFPPNVDAAVRFVQRVWPGLLARDPRRELLLVGRAPLAAVQRLAQRPGVRLYADVADVRPYVAAAAVVIAPVRQGGGVKNKVLEALAMRRAVVAAPNAIRGLSVRPGHELLTAHAPREWRAAIERLLADDNARRWLAAAGCRWVRRHHAWRDILAPLPRRLAELGAPRQMLAGGGAERVVVSARRSSRWEAREAPACR